ALPHAGQRLAHDARGDRRRRAGTDRPSRWRSAHVFLSRSLARDGRRRTQGALGFAPRRRRARESLRIRRRRRADRLSDLVARREARPLRSLPSPGRRRLDDGRLRVTALLLVTMALSANAFPTKGWPTSTPAAVGMNIAVLAELDSELAAG